MKEFQKIEMGIPSVKEIFSTKAFAKALENSEMEPQQEIAAIGYFLLRQRAESLGQKVKDLDPSSIATWDEYHEHFWSDFSSGGDLENASAVYNSKLNKLTSDDGGKSASLSKYTHEMAHYLNNSQNVSFSEESKHRLDKTGFASVFDKKDPENDIKYRESLNLFNEGMTEIITHDLCDDMTLEKLGDLYKEIFPKQSKENLEQSKDNHKNWLEKIKIQEKEMQERELADFAKYIEGVTDEKQIEKLTYAHQQKMGMCQRLIKSHEKRLLAMEILPFEGDVNPLEDKDEVGYPEMVKLCNSMIDGIAHKNAKEKSITFDEARRVAYDEMQKAYFCGNTMHLRVLESVYGEGFLKKLSNLSYETIVEDEEERTITWKEYDELKNLIEIVNNSIKV